MARKLRVQYPGAVYHVMSRGDRREAIFKTNADRQLFLQCLDEACARTGWRVYAWCLMGNHFHLVIQTPKPNLVAGMTWLLGVYTGRFNRRHKLFGHLFSGRYKAQIVDGSGNGYLKTVCDYVHLNPVRARLLRSGDKLESFRWSSLGHYLQSPRNRPAWLQVRPLLGEHGIPRDSTAGRREFGRRMELRRQAEENPGQLKALRRGWCFGDKLFRKELLAQMKEQIAEHHFGEERTETEEEQAEQVVREGLTRLRWPGRDLPARPKGDERKLKLALRLRVETTMSLKWIARRLQMGTWTHLNHLLYWHRRSKTK